jgi:hypothetical protein
LLKEVIERLKVSFWEKIQFINVVIGKIKRVDSVAGTGIVYIM